MEGGWTADGTFFNMSLCEHLSTDGLQRFVGVREGIIPVAVIKTGFAGKAEHFSTTTRF